MKKCSFFLMVLFALMGGGLTSCSSLVDMDNQSDEDSASETAIDTSGSSGSDTHSETDTSGNEFDTNTDIDSTPDTQTYSGGGTDTNVDTVTDAATDSNTSTEATADTNTQTDTETTADTHTETETDTGPACPGCLIEGDCYSANELHPANVCLICNPSSSSSDWSDNDGRSCDDTFYCTVEDSCQGGTCTGSPRSCDDEIDCNGLESCDTQLDKCVGGESTCASDQFCDVAKDSCVLDCSGCIIDGSCIPDGTASTTNSCLVCDPLSSSTDWTIRVNASCDDGDFCTENDSCNALAQCEGTDVQCDDEPGTCGANRSCDPANGQCIEQFPGNSTTCDDGEACTNADRCDGAGGCSGTPIVCNDNLTCTVDTCNGGICEYALSSSYCKIDNTCVLDGTSNSSNVCQYCNRASDAYNWSPKPNTVKCTDDGEFCNGDEYCNGSGQCEGQGNPCSGISGACAVATCDETNNTCYRPATYICEYDVTEYNCTASNTCGANAQYRTGDRHCTGSSSPCDGTMDWDNGGTWSILDQCNDGEKCNIDGGGVAGCEYDAACGMWCDDVNGLCWQNECTSDFVFQGEAAEHCDDLNTANWKGYDDWELPNVDDLITLLRGCQDGTVVANGESACVMTRDSYEDCVNVSPYYCDADTNCAACTAGNGANSGCYVESHISASYGDCDTYWTSTPADSMGYSRWTVSTETGDLGMCGPTGATCGKVLCVRKN
jgi:hypothetical protein